MVLLGALTTGLLAAVAVHLSTRRDAPGKKESLDSLLRGPHRRVFVGMVMIAGTAVPALLAFIGAGVADARDAISVISFALLVSGGFLLRLITLRVGIYPPVHLADPERGRRSRR
jgi:formate-dependent nitrite reductase membrane component NrfD